MKNMSPQDLADENNELMQEIARLKSENEELKKERDRESARAKHAELQYIRIQDEYIGQISFYERKHPNLRYEYELFLEENNQHL